MRYIIAPRRRPESAYGFYLRTGCWPDPVEIKSNPNHDPHNGRFTFKAGGSGPAPGARSSGHPPTPPSKQPGGSSGDDRFPAAEEAISAAAAQPAIT